MPYIANPLEGLPIRNSFIVDQASLGGAAAADDTLLVYDISATALKQLTVANLQAGVLASPAFTGVPTAPTANAGTSTTQLATTAFVTTANNLLNTVAEMTDVTITSIAANEVLKWNGSAWINNTLAEANILTVAGPTFTGVLTVGSAVLSEADLEQIDDLTAGTAVASKALVVDSNKDIGTLRNLTIDGVFTDGNYTFDTSGNVTGLGTIGSGAITSTGVITGLTIEATGDTAASDNAAIGYTAAEGLILTGQGSTNDVTIKNDADATVMSIPTGATGVTFAGTVGSGAITSTGVVTATGFTIGSAVITEGELELLDGLTAGTALGTKVVTTDGSVDTTGQRNLTITGELIAATLDISGNVDIDGTLEADAYTVDGVVLSTYIRDTVGTNMLSSNTESGIAVTYDTTNDNIDFAVSAAQTGITSVYNTSLKVGRDADNLIDFASTDNEIIFRVAGANEVRLAADILSPVTSDGIALGTGSLMWSDLFLAAGGVINFNNSNMTITHTSAGLLTVAGGTLATAALTTTTIVASGIMKTDDATEATTTTDGSLQTDGGLSVVKDAVFGDDVKLLSDSAVLSFGADSDTTLTHTDGTGIGLNGTNKITFNDASQFIQGASNAILALGATDEIDLTATAIDINGTVDISGTLAAGTTTIGSLVVAAASITDSSGTISFGNENLTTSGIVTAGGITLGSAVLIEAELELLDDVTAGTAIASKVVTTDSNIDTTGQRNLTITGELDAATGDFSGVVDVAGAFTTSTIVASGIIKTDATTNATSITDGSLQTDGGLSVALDAIIGDDLTLLSDAAVLNFGVNSDVNLTHVHDTGLLLNSTRQIQFGDAGTYIHQSADGVLDLVSDTELELNATTIDINGNVQISGTITHTATRTIVLTAAGGAALTTAGCADPEKIEAASNDINYWVLGYDTSTEEHAFWNIQMPDSYDGGVLNATFVWTNTGGSSSQTVVWGIAGRAFANDAAIDQALGTEVTVTDTWLAQGDVHISPISGDITLAGSPAGGQWVNIVVARKVGSDNMSGDARLLSVKLEYTITQYSD